MGSGLTDVNGRAYVDLTGVPAATSATRRIAVFLDNAGGYGMYDLYNMSLGANWVQRRSAAEAGCLSR